MMMVRNLKNCQPPRARYPVEALTRLGVPLLKEKQARFQSPSSINITKS